MGAPRGMGEGPSAGTINSHRRGGSMFGNSTDDSSSATDNSSPFGSVPSSGGSSVSSSTESAKRVTRAGASARTVTAGSMFGSPSGGRDAVDDLFSAPPASQRKTTQTSPGDADLFSAPPPAATANGMGSTPQREQQRWH